MNIITNLKLIRRYTILAQAGMLGGLAVLAGGMFLSFKNPARADISLIALFLGFLLSQVGIYYSNHYARRPRPDELLNQALKGLDGRYTLYHYSSPVSHLLVGPSGIWILMPRFQRGEISFVNGRYKQKGGNLYLKLFAQEGLGRPEMEIAADKDKLTGFLRKNLNNEDVPEVQAALIFTHPSAKINISEDEVVPAATVTRDQLKDMVRKSKKNKGISPVTQQQVLDLLPKE
jgi:hypothetical protein